MAARFGVFFSVDVNIQMQVLAGLSFTSGSFENYSSQEPTH